MTTKLKKSLTSLPRRSGGWSSTSTGNYKRDRSSSGSHRLSFENSFEIQFRRFCERFKSWIVPDVLVVPHEPTPGDFPELPSESSKASIKDETIKVEQKLSKPTVLLIFDNYEIQTVLNTVICKHFRVDRSMLIALKRTLHKFDTLGTLKLEFCQLSNTDLRTLKLVLQNNELITDLSINGNPNRFQNFYILLKNTKLVCVSMRFCQINDRGATLISAQLRTTDEPTLVLLNLSSNFISDEGAAAIAAGLRSNRSLISLNLADNWLTDAGCVELMGVLQIFPLKHEEIVLRRHRILDFLLKKAELIELEKVRQASEILTMQSSNKRTSKDSTSKMGKGNGSTRKSSKGHSSLSSVHKKDYTTRSLELDIYQIQQAVELEMHPDKHPFVADSVAEDMEINCKGNLKLMHMNLAYNKITELGLQEVNKMLQYQAGAAHPREGLIHITIEGNLFSDLCNEFSDFNLLMQDVTSRHFSICASDSKRNSTKRKRSGIRVSITL